MKRAIVSGLVALGVLATLPSPGGAQAPVSFEIHGGLGLPTGDFGDVAESGFSLGVEALLDVTGFLGVYGGFSLSGLPCDETSPEIQCNPTDEFESSGFGVGVRGRLPLDAVVRPWASLGAVFHDIQRAASTAQGNTGLEVGLGVEIELGDVLVLGPQARYRSYSLEDPQGEEAITEIDFVTLELAARFRFGR